MDSMKKSLFTVVLMVLLVLSLNAAPAGYWSFHSELDLALGLKAGAEYRLNSFGIRGSAGFSLLGPAQLSYTLVGVSHLMPEKNRFQLDIQYGLIQAVCDFLTPLVNAEAEEDNPYTYWFPGACICASFLTKKGHRFGIRAGAGAGLGYDQGMWREPFFLPNLALEYGYCSGK